jgi:hypothetical protein
MKVCLPFLASLCLIFIILYKFSNRVNYVSYFLNFSPPFRMTFRLLRRFASPDKGLRGRSRAGKMWVGQGNRRRGTIKAGMFTNEVGARSPGYAGARNDLSSRNLGSFSGEA